MTHKADQRTKYEVKPWTYPNADSADSERRSTPPNASGHPSSGDQRNIRRATGGWQPSPSARRRTSARHVHLLTRLADLLRLSFPSKIMFRMQLRIGAGQISDHVSHSTRPPVFGVTLESPCHTARLVANGRPVDQSIMPYRATALRRPKRPRNLYSTA